MTIEEAIQEASQAMERRCIIYTLELMYTLELCIEILKIYARYSHKLPSETKEGE